jgi:DNA-binding transcriptional LysR family regulator
MNKLVAMRVFCRVVSRQSFSAAARDLEISPAMVSRHVSELEQQLGVRLLHRTTRRVTATEAGMRYFEESMRLLDAMEEIETNLRSGEREPRGTLRVSCPLDFGVLKLAPAIAGYLERFPGVRIDADFNDRKVNLVEEGFDLAIRIGAMEDSNLVARRLAPVTFTCCASPSYIARHGEPRTPKELSDHQCITYTYSATRNDWHFEKDGQRFVARVAGRLNSTNGRASVKVAVNGAGIIVKPDFMVEAELKSNLLVPVLRAYTIPSSAVYAVYPHREFLPARVRGFIDYLDGCFND